MTSHRAVVFQGMPQGVCVFQGVDSLRPDQAVQQLQGYTPPEALYTQVNVDPVCCSNPPLAPPKRGTGVILGFAL
jgi:hypothetical protein